MSKDDNKNIDNGVDIANDKANDILDDKNLNESLDFENDEKLIETVNIDDSEKTEEIKKSEDEPKEKNVATKKPKTKQIKYQVMAAISILIVTAIVVVVNIFTTEIFKRYPIATDVTSDKVYDMTEETADFISKIDDKVRVTILADEDVFQGSYDVENSIAKAHSMLIRYVQQSSNLSLDYINIVENPSLTNEFPDEDLQPLDVMFRSGDKVKVISFNDMFDVTTDYQTGQQQLKGYKVEEIMSKSIMAVTATDMNKVIVLSGFDSVYKTQAVENLLKDNNYNTETVNILTEELDLEADVLVLTAPARDLSTEEIKKIDAFLDNGGELGKTLYFMPSKGKGLETPNLDAFLADWGLEVEDSYVYETDDTKLIEMQPLFLTFLGEYKNAELSNGLQNKPFLVTLSHPIKTLFETSGNRSTEVLVASTSSAYLRAFDAPDDFDYPKEGTNGPFNIVAVGKKAHGGSSIKESRIIVNTSPASMDYGMSLEIFGNAEYTINLFNYIYPNKYDFKVTSKDINNSQLPITGRHVQIIFVLFLILLPLTVLITGLVIWLRRLRK